jgi:hypothetical protein
MLVRPNISMGCSAFLVFDLQWAPVQAKIEVSSLAPENVIKPDELQFPIGILVDWQSPIGCLCSNQADRLHS